MRRSILIIAIILSMLVSMMVISASETVDPSFVFKANSDVNLRVTCKNNGTLCSPSAVCNITIIYPSPNNSVMVSQAPMTNDYSFFSYTLPDTSIVGVYKATMNCIDGGLGGVKDFNFQLTQTGDLSNFSFWLIMAFFTLTIFIVAIYSGNEYIMFISSGAMLLTGIYSFIFGIGNLYNIYTQGLGIIVLGLGIFFLIISSLKAIAEASDENTIGGWGPGGEDDYDYFKG